MAVADDGSILTFGTPEGDMQCQAMVQVFLNIFHFGMDIQEAIDAPRFATFSFPSSLPATCKPERARSMSKVAFRRQFKND